MSLPDEPLRLNESDLYSPRVDAYLEEQAVLQRAIPEAEPRPLLVRILFSSYFYLSLASAAGALCAWAILEPFFNEQALGEDRFNLAHVLMFPTVAGMIGLFLGAAEGFMC